MLGRTKIILGALLLLLIFSVIYTVTTNNTKAHIGPPKCIHCYYCVEDKTCPEGVAYVRFNCCVNPPYNCPASPDGCLYLQKLGCGCGVPGVD